MSQIASLKTKSGDLLVNGNMELISSYDCSNCFDEDGEFNPEADCHNWQDMLEKLSTLMRKVNERSNKWVARVENFGWRKCHGHKTFKANRPEVLLQEVLPKTENTFKIFFRESDYGGKLAAPIKEIVIQNWHHDNSNGDEHYYITGDKNGVN